MKLNINKTKFEKISNIDVPDIFYNRLKSGIDVVDNAFGDGFLPSSTVVMSGNLAPVRLHSCCKCLRSSPFGNTM